jgi:hypothetical protein
VIFLELQDSVLKEFSDAINKTDDSGEKTRSVYGIAVKDDSGLYVRFDGSEINTPATTTVEVGDGDRVLAAIRGHNAVITGNVSWPSLTRKGPVFMTLTTEGLVIGVLNESNIPEGHHMLITNSDVEVIDPTGAIAAKFGTTTQIGKSSTVHAVTTATGLKVLDNKDNVIARFEDTVQVGRNDKPHTNINNNRFEIYDGSNNLVGYFGDTAQVGKTAQAHLNLTGTGMTLAKGTTTLATFTSELISLAQGLVQISSNLVKLGNSTNSKIQLCAGNGEIDYSGDKLRIKGASSTKAVGISNSYGSYRSELVAEANATNTRVGMQLANGNNAIGSFILDANGAHTTVPSGKGLYVNNTQVLTADSIVSTGYTDLMPKTRGFQDYDSVTLNVAVPTGFKLIGVTGFGMINRNGNLRGHVNISHYYVSGNQIILSFCFIDHKGEPSAIEDSNGNVINLTGNNHLFGIRVYWFAIRSKAITSGGSQTLINW